MAVAAVLKSEDGILASPWPCRRNLAAKAVRLILSNSLQTHKIKPVIDHAVPLLSLTEEILDLADPNRVAIRSLRRLFF